MGLFKDIFGVDPLSPMQTLEELDRREQRYAEIRNKQLRDAMTDIENPAGKIAGYTAQPDAKVALVNAFKESEERLLRQIDKLTRTPQRPDDADQRLLAMGRSYAQIAYMLLNRAVFQPQRIKLPEDGE